MSPRPRANPTARRRCFTLVEAVLSLVLVAALLVAALGALGMTTAVRRRAEPRALGGLLADELMTEILRRPYEDPEGAAALGPDPGETDGTRAPFDDVDDYDGWSASPPQLADGTTMPDLAGWTRSVHVTRADPLDVSQASGAESGIKRITVQVTHLGAPAAELTAIRTAAWPAPGGSSEPTVLLIVADAVATTPQDQARADLLRSWGWTVMAMSASAPASELESAATVADVAYVVEQQQSTALGTKLRDAPIGVVNEEVELRADFGFAANRDWPTPTATIDLVDDTHFITSPFTVGPLAIATQDVEIVTLAGQLAGGLEVLSTSDWGGGQTGMAVIETGGPLYGGGTAPARRVQLPWGRVGFDIGHLNADGRTLMRRAVDWAGERAP